MLRDRREQIQENIVTTLRAVSGVENVYDTQQRIPDAERLIEKFGSERGAAMQRWWVRRVSGRMLTTENARGQVPVGAVRVEHTFQLNVIYGYKEETPENVASEPTFQGIVDDVLDAFLDKRSLGGFTSMAPLSLFGDIVDRWAHSVYVHSATFRVSIFDDIYGVDPT